MKKFTFILFILVAITFTVNAQWTLQTNPLGSGDPAMVGKIQFVSATEGWIACGSNGSLLHTTNAGVTWNIVTPFPNEKTGNMSDPALSMSWVNPTHGWALKTLGSLDSPNGAVLYNTTNAGNSWAKKELPATIQTATYSTADIQGTWQFHVITAKNPSIYASIAGWMYGTVTVNVTSCSLSVLRSDGTTRNKVISMTISSLGVISVNGEERGFMSADKSTAIMTGIEDNDGYSMYVMQKQIVGTTYSTADLQGAWQMHALSVGNSSAEHGGWAHAEVNADAGGNFTGSFVGVGGGGPINAIALISPSGIISMSSIGTNTHGFMSADKKSFYLTMTGSENGDFNLVVFQKQLTGTTYTTSDLRGSWQMQILSADCTNDYESLAYYAHGQMNLNGKGDGNLSYFSSNSQTESYKELSMSVSSDGIISGFGDINSHGFMSSDKSLGIGTLTDASDDGSGYTLFVMQKDLSVSGDIGLQAQFVDNNNGWVSIYNQSSNNFKLYKTTDGGTTLNPINNTVGGLYQFKDANNGWMVGTTINNIGQGTLNNIYHTTDGGSTWSEQASNIGNANALYFSDQLHGWIVGNNGLILKTVNGGTNWTTITNAGLTSQSNSKTVFFLDANTGWIGTGLNNSEGQFVLATKDGGSTWATESTPVTNSIFSISFWDANNGWFTSGSGQIAHYSYTPPKTVNITAGGLSATLSASEKSTITNLIVTGKVDARDFKTMRDDMPLLASIDLSGTSIVAYSGTEGTYSSVTDYPANTIPNRAFYNSTTKQAKTSLSSFIFPTSVTTIDFYAFRASGLTSITIPSTVTTMGYGNFYYCVNLKNVTFESPSQLSTIGTYAFGFCSQLTSFTVPSTVTSMGDVVFLGSAVSVTVDSNNSYFSNLDGVLFDKNKNRLIYYPVTKTGTYIIPSMVTTITLDAFYNCNKLTDITFPMSVTTMEEWAFENCSGLSTLTLPSTLTTIKGYAFYNCWNLTAIYANAASPLNLSASDSVFKWVDKNRCSLYVSAGSKSLYQSAYQWKDFTNIVELNYKTINVSAGELYSALTPLELSTTTDLKITGTIDARDFKTMRDNMSLLTNLDISEVVVVSYSGTAGPNEGNTTYATNAIPNHAFYTQSTNTGKISLKTIKLPPTITKIEGSAFTSSGLTSITFPNGVTTVEDWAFAACNLSSVYLPATLSSIGWCTFTFNNSLSAFQVAGDNPYLSTIDGVLFDKMQNTIICYPNGKRGNEGNIYQIPSGVTVVDKSAFAGWGLEKVLIPPSVNTLSKYAFFLCESLKSIEIPSSVTSIGESAFNKCSGLTSITVSATYPVDLSYSNDVFLDVNKTTCILKVPRGSKSAYQSANQWRDFVNIEEFITDISDIAVESINIFPNPVTESFKVNGLQSNAMLRLFDITGKMIFTKSIVDNEYVSVNTLPPGLYIVKITMNESTIEKKLLKK